MYIGIIVLLFYLGVKLGSQYENVQGGRWAVEGKVSRGWVKFSNERSLVSAAVEQNSFVFWIITRNEVV